MDSGLALRAPRNDEMVAGYFEDGHEPFEICFAKRDPNAPGEIFRCAVDGKFQAAANEEIPLIDHTGIAG
jgi:hypothetical protein